jgi:hypothetical protein
MLQLREHLADEREDHLSLVYQRTTFGEWYPYGMQIALDIPDELAAQIAPAGMDMSRAALEALAVEGYRTERLSESAIRRLLGFQTRMEVHAFLKEHGAYLHYSLAELERDRESAQRAKDKRKSDSGLR